MPATAACLQVSDLVHDVPPSWRQKLVPVARYLAATA